MKQRFFEKLMASLCGLVLFAVSMCVFLWCFGFVPMEWASAIPKMELSVVTHIAVIAASILLMFLGAYCMTLLFRRGNRKRGFVVQKTDNGQLSISIRAMENMVQKCIDQHEEVHILGSHISNTRDGVVVSLQIGLANGVSIPLAVNALQKQIRQYIQSCSGIDVKEVRVQVDSANAKVADSPFMVHDVLPKLEETEPAIKEQATHEPMEPPKIVPIAFEQEAQTEPKERKPLHQRLFGRTPEPVVVPIWPEPKAEPVLAHDEEEATEEAEEATEEVAEVETPVQDEEAAEAETLFEEETQGEEH